MYWGNIHDNYKFIVITVLLSSTNMKKKPQKNNPFKVDHVRSIKLKAKAKQYKGNLKQVRAFTEPRLKL